MNGLFLFFFQETSKTIESLSSLASPSTGPSSTISPVSESVISTETASNPAFASTSASDTSLVQDTVELNHSESLITSKGLAGMLEAAAASGIHISSETNI